MKRVARGSRKGEEEEGEGEGDSVKERGNVFILIFFFISKESPCSQNR